ncbi:Adenylate cyclase [hydrothermal vent metagenome]|uniref:Adenylate cyclase n=1 Tax=hydrothermal vent metagenome TaxID=652676 RepID=A0A3B0YJC3_9ZZZZ
MTAPPKTSGTKPLVKENAGDRVIKARFGRQNRAAIEIDALELRAVRRRFMAINQDRLRRVRESLENRQLVFMQLLPLLFHINHPMLPGYLSNKTPCGISGYAPGKRCIQSARKLARSFSYQRRAQRRYSIHALYMMGSTGTIAYSRASDFDIWICHRPGLPKDEIAALRDKADDIQSWAESLGLEVHFFLMDDVSFRDQEHQQLSNENAGSSQHHLLLDEFYRTGLLIAGRFPAWWLVPPRYEARYDEYVDKLIVNRFIKAGDIVDFGGLSELPSEEFFGATLWQLYKAVDSPYKSILKILLMEAYANQYPDIDLLAMRFKKLVHQADVQLDHLDPYVMMCNTVEEYLFSRREMERLDLARRCFYFKVNEAMSKPDRGLAQSWRREAIRDLVNSWGWSQSKLLTLDQRQQWKIKRVLKERHLLVDELTRSYRALSQFGRDNDDSKVAINANDLNLLGRKLYVAFERKAGKVELINPGVSSDLSEDRLSLHYINEEGQHGWAMYRGSILEQDAHEHDPLKRSAGLLELLVWCHINGLINRNPSTVSIHPTECCLSQWELRSVLDCLQQLFPGGKLPETDMHALAKQATLREAGLFINLAQDPMSKLTRNGMQLVSERIDPLSYGGQWENLAISFQMIAVTTWGELLTFRYNGHTALMDCLCDYFAWLPVNAGASPPHIPCFSFSSSRGAIIARRIEDLFRDVADYFYRNYWRRHARYALRIGQHYFVLQCENDVPRYLELESREAMLDHLGQAQAAFSPIHIDEQTLDNSPLGVALKHNREGVVQLFYRLDHGHAEVWILDELGSLFHQRIIFRDRQTLLGQFQRFLEAVRYRLSNMQQPSSLSDNDTAEYYRVVRDNMGQWFPETQKASHGNDSHYLDVQVIGSPDDKAQGTFSIFCGNHEFSVLEHGENIYLAVAQYVTKQRGSGSRYPIHITDIDLSSSVLASESGGGVQTIHFLNQKKHIENLLNDSLHQLRKK